MRFGKTAATAVMAVVAVGLASGTAHGEPAVLADPAVTSSANGIDYQVGMSGDGQSIVATVGGGEFELTADRSAVTLADATGNVVERLPLSYVAHGQEVPLAAAIADDGQTLTLTPASAPLQYITPGQDWFMAELQHAAPGALVGAIIGGLIGIFFFGIGLIPGAAIGAVIGLLVAGGQPLIDSGFAYFSGQ